MEKQKMNLENDMESIIYRLHERRKQDELFKTSKQIL